MNLDRLISFWKVYMEATKESPYDADRVQGLGMCFADEWHLHEKWLQAHFKVADKDWGYIHRQIMPQLIED